jgi:hypothetical protein
MSERAVLAITAELKGELPAIRGFARLAVDGLKKMGAAESCLEVDVSSSLTKPSSERARPTRPVSPDDLEPDERPELICAICEVDLRGKNVTTIEGGRIVCKPCAAKAEVTA